MEHFRMLNRKRARFFLIIFFLIFSIGSILLLITLTKIGNKNTNKFTISNEENISLGPISTNIDIVYLKKGYLYGRSDTNTDYQITLKDNFSHFNFSPRAKRIAALNRNSPSSIYLLDLVNEKIKLIYLTQPDVSKEKIFNPTLLKFSPDGSLLLFASDTEIYSYNYRTNNVTLLVSLDSKEELAIPNYDDTSTIKITNISMSPQNKYLEYTYYHEGTHLNMYNLDSDKTDTVITVTRKLVTELGWENNSNFAYAVLTEGSSETYTPQTTEIRSYSVSDKKNNLKTSLKGFIQQTYEGDEQYVIVTGGTDLSQYIHVINKETYEITPIFTLPQEGDREMFRLKGVPFINSNYIYITYFSRQHLIEELWKIDKKKSHQTEPDLIIKDATL